MKKENLLVTGLGQCGCTLADALRRKNSRYTPLYINSSLGDIKDLDFAKLDTNVFIFSGVDGAGRDRSKAKQFIAGERIRLASILKNYSQFKNMLIFTSLSGGTGSGTLIDFIKIVKQVNPRMIINLVAVLPSLNENKKEWHNTMECLQELEEVSSFINDIKFINNNKGNSYEEINEKAATDIDLSYGMISHSSIGSIDEDNLTNVITCPGYGVILRIDPTYINIEEAIEKAVENSVFEIPENLTCVYGAVNVSKQYNIDVVRKVLDVKETLYVAYGNKNILTLGGCDFPSEAIDEIESNLQEKLIRNDEEARKSFKFKSKYENEEILVDSAMNTKKVTKTKRVKEIYLDDDDIDKLFEMDNLDFDE